MAKRGLPRLSGGILARERAAWAAPCLLHQKHGVERLTVGVIDSLNGPKPVCEECAERGERLGYTIRRTPLT